MENLNPHNLDLSLDELNDTELFGSMNMDQRETYYRLATELNNDLNEERELIALAQDSEKMSDEGSRVHIVEELERLNKNISAEFGRLSSFGAFTNRESQERISFDLETAKQRREMGLKKSPATYPMPPLAPVIPIFKSSVAPSQEKLHAPKKSLFRRIGQSVAFAIASLLAAADANLIKIPELQMNVREASTVGRSQTHNATVESIYQSARDPYSDDAVVLDEQTYSENPYIRQSLPLRGQPSITHKKTSIKNPRQWAITDEGELQGVFAKAIAQVKNSVYRLDILNRIRETANKPLDSKSCWDYTVKMSKGSATYDGGWRDENHRNGYSRQKKDPRFVDPQTNPSDAIINSIKPGDRIAYDNENIFDEYGSHSGLFVGWKDRKNLLAIVSNHHYKIGMPTVDVVDLKKMPLTFFMRAHPEKSAEKIKTVKNTRSVSL